MTRILSLFLLGLCLNAGAAPEKCPWGRVDFKPGTLTLTPESVARLNTLMGKSPDRIGRLRIYGLFPSERLRTPETTKYFDAATTSIKRQLAFFLSKKPGWKVTARQIRSPKTAEGKGSYFEVEFHGYDDPQRHEDTIRATASETESQR